jgi:secreted trypsin-like serine protease
MAVGLASCGPAPQSPSNSGKRASNGIVGGDFVTTEAFAKHVVGIYNKPKNYWCTATLIGPHTVVTAAHCFMGAASDHEILFIKKANETPVRKSRFVSYKAHPAYNANAWVNRNDVAVASFDVDYPQGYEPAAFPTEEELAKISDDFYAIGFGTTTARRIPDNGVGFLRYTHLKISEGGLKPDQNQFLVDQSKGHGICFGDSGGPAFVKLNNHHVIIGTVSAVYSKDEAAKKQPDFDVCRYNAIYMSVYPYKDWIQKTSAELAPR